MGALQGEMRDLAMIEARPQPSRLVVTGLAGLAKALAMDIVNGVAVIAGCGQAAIDFAEMTGSTGSACVLSVEREAGLAMIE